MLFSIIFGKTLQEMGHVLSKLSPSYRHVELRLDSLSVIDIGALGLFMSARADLKWLLTLRPARQGGKYVQDEGIRLKLIRELCALTPDYVDLEYDVPLSIWSTLTHDFPSIQWICSYHSSDATWPLKFHNPYAHFHKVVIIARSSLDTLALMARISQTTYPCTGIAIGPNGFFSRLFNPIIGCPLNYVSIQPHPLIPSIDMLEYPYRYSHLNTHTRIYALIGTHLDHSIGYIRHNDFFDRHDINAVYCNIPLAREELPDFVRLARSLPFHGFSVTMPFKKSILPYLDEIDPIALQIGAVNTIDIRNGKWIGYNTDGQGALDSLPPVSDKHIVILGSGGAARAIGYEAKRRGACVSYLTRHSSSCEWEAINARGYDILINTTPDNTWFPASFLRSDAMILDIDLRSAYGLSMWHAQAKLQQKIWFNHEKDIFDMDHLAAAPLLASSSSL